MPMPARLLSDGEQVVVDVRPHVWALAGSTAITLVVLAGAIAGLVARVGTVVRWVLAGLLALALLHLLGRWLAWRSTSLIVTTSRVVERRGIVSRSGREIPLSHLADISYHQSIFDRMIGAGDLLLQSAGRDSTEVFPALPHPAMIQNEVYKLLSAHEDGRDVAGGGLSLPEQIEKLVDLHRRGVLSDEEFAATKARLLQGR